MKQQSLVQQTRVAWRYVSRSPQGSSKVVQMSAYILCILTSHCVCVCVYLCVHARVPAITHLTGQH